MLSNSQDHKYSITFGNMGKMYFPDEVPNRKTAHSEQHKAYKRELTKVILIWVVVIVLIIIDIILFTQFL